MSKTNIKFAILFAEENIRIKHIDKINNRKVT